MGEIGAYATKTIGQQREHIRPRLSHQLLQNDQHTQTYKFAQIETGAPEQSVRCDQ